MLLLGGSRADGTHRRTLALVGVTSPSFRSSPQMQPCGVTSAFCLSPPQDGRTMLTCGERKALPERDWGVGGASRGPSVCMRGCTNLVAPPCRARWRPAVRSHGDRSSSSCKIAFFPLETGSLCSLWLAWNSLHRSGLPGTQHLPPLPLSAGVRGVWYRAR